MENNEKHEEEMEQTENTVDETVVQEETGEDIVQEEQKAEAEAEKQASTSKEKTKEELQKELGEMKDKYLRIFAEFDNYRKRTIKEKVDIIKLASKDVINAMLPAIDDFSRAVKLDGEANVEDKIPEGIVHVYNKLMKGLEQQGVRPMESTGADFDAELHEALTKIPAPTPELKGKVIDTIEQGYYLNDKIIRYAKVVVGE